MTKDIFGSLWDKPGHPHSWFHGINLANHHYSLQMGSKSLTIKDQGRQQLLEGAAADEH